MPAIIEELAGVGGHRLGRDTAALGTGQRGGELHQESAFISGASMRSHISAVSVRAVPIVSMIGVARDGRVTVPDRSERPRSEERRVGNECVSTGGSRWSPKHYKNKNKH